MTYDKRPKKGTRPFVARVKWRYEAKFSCACCYLDLVDACEREEIVPPPKLDYTSEFFVPIYFLEKHCVHRPQSPKPIVISPFDTGVTSETDSCSRTTDSQNTPKPEGTSLLRRAFSYSRGAGEAAKSLLRRLRQGEGET